MQWQASMILRHVRYQARCQTAREQLVSTIRWSDRREISWTAEFGLAPPKMAPSSCLASTTQHSLQSCSTPIIEAYIVQSCLLRAAACPYWAVVLLIMIIRPSEADQPSNCCHGLMIPNSVRHPRFIYVCGDMSTSISLFFKHASYKSSSLSSYSFTFLYSRLPVTPSI